MGDSSRRYTKKEKDFLRENYEVQGLAYCMASLDRSEGSIVNQAYKLKLKGSHIRKLQTSKPRVRKEWSIEDTQWLLSNYNVIGLAGCCEILQRTKGSILHKVSTLNTGRRGIYFLIDAETIYRHRVYLKTAAGWVPRARRVIEQSLGRSLLSSEEVHHLDEDSMNDSLENLYVCSKSEHMRIHAQTRKDPTTGQFR